MKKFWVCLSAITVLLIGLSMHVAAETGISVEVDGKSVVFTDAKPFIDANGRTLVPLRPIADAMHMTVEWDAAAAKATFKKTYNEDDSRLYYAAKDGSLTDFIGHDEITFTIGSKTALIRQKWLPIRGDIGALKSIATVKAENNDTIMDTEAIIVDGRTYAPVRYLAEAIGYTVTWDAARNAVVISAQYGEVATEPPVTPKPPTATEKTLNDCGLDWGYNFIQGMIVIGPTYNYTGTEIKEVNITSVKINGFDVSLEQLAPMPKGARNIIARRPPEISKWVYDESYVIEVTAIVEYVDGNKVTVYEKDIQTHIDINKFPRGA